MRYRLFILSLWKESSAASHNAPAWRYGLEDPQTGERFGFADFDALALFLQDPALLFIEEGSADAVIAPPTQVKTGDST